MRPGEKSDRQKRRALWRSIFFAPAGHLGAGLLGAGLIFSGFDILTVRTSATYDMISAEKAWPGQDRQSYPDGNTSLRVHIGQKGQGRCPSNPRTYLPSVYLLEVPTPFS